jgi:bifunctional non-homologous end joining protein LigD
VSFIAPMLATRLSDGALLMDPRYIAEPKLDGQRVQVHLAGRRAVACYSRRGRELLHYRGLAWLRELDWPVGAAVLDGELFHGNGADGIEAVLSARTGNGRDLALAVFDILAVDGRDLLTQPWQARRAALERLLPATQVPRVQLVPTCGDAKRMWDTWVEEWGGEGIVLKDRRSLRC